MNSRSKTVFNESCIFLNETLFHLNEKDQFLTIINSLFKIISVYEQNHMLFCTLLISGSLYLSNGS